MRIIVALLAGILTAAFWFAPIVVLNDWLYPRIPEGPPISPARDLLKVVGWFTSALAGGVVANAISRRWWTAVLVAGCIIATTSAFTLLNPHPMWMKVAGVAAPLFAAELANRFTRSWTAS